MILPDYLLRFFAKRGMITPYSPDLVNPSSIDLRLSNRIRFAEPSGWTEVQDLQRGIWINPFQFVLLDTLETIKLPSFLAGRLYLKSSRGREGHEHSHACFFEPDFTGTATLEVSNVSPWPLLLEPGMRFVQLVVEFTLPPRKSYKKTGHYNGQNEPRLSYQDINDIPF